MMNSTFLDYYKIILEKVSFDPELVRKEYNKAKKLLGGHEVCQLDSWLRAKGLDRPVRQVHAGKTQEKEVTVRL